MRFWHEMLIVANEETANGKVVLMPFVTKGHTVDRAMLDRLHRQKMDMADGIIVVTDVGYYLGKSTQHELSYAIESGKPIQWRLHD
jgi:hypothetical protein